MRLIKTATQLRLIVENLRKSSKLIGFVPTMGALHNGHISLIEESIQKSDITICSIFVNPTQFNDKKDLEKYPRTIEKDILLLERAGCDILFLPAVAEIYPPGYQPRHYELDDLEKILEGKYRPGHFQGVCQVLDRLFEMVQPDNIFFGQKDYQQCRVVQELLKQTPAFQSIKMFIAPTLRETNGLAMSSRNTRLSAEQRKIAPVIFKTLQLIKDNLQPGSLDGIIHIATEKLNEAGLKPDYISIAAAENLQELKSWDGKTKTVALIAAYVGEIRLIDNLILND